ncbi:P-loop containing nucleoside triphosphate hydrolase protein, partial [Mycena latifolia]
MPRRSTITQTRLNNILECLATTVATLERLSAAFNTPFLLAISSTTQSLFIEQIHKLLYAIIILHIKSDSDGELPPSMLHHIGKFTETLHKIHTFVEAQQETSRFKQIFRHGEMSTLVKECKIGLQQALEIFKIETIDLITDVTKMQQYAQKRHQEVLELIECCSDASSSVNTTTGTRIFSTPYNSSNSISMLPSEPKIFHGRESELSDILKAFTVGVPRIAILGAGGMGKTSLARAVLHHPDITARYGHYRIFVTCDSVSTKVDLASLVGAHLGLRPGKDLTRPIIRHLSGSPPCLLILDNMETLWEPTEHRMEIEEFLSLLADIEHMAMIITMRGAERPAKVRWTRPFMHPLEPLTQDAAQQTFIAIADDIHNSEDINKILSLTGNMPLAVTLMAHLVDSEGCLSVLSRWEREGTSLVSVGYDRRSNLDLSISLSLSSPRVVSLPHAQDLLSVLAMLPDGLSDTELLQSNLCIDNILSCKAALLQTALAYSDDHGKLKTLVPIREYMHKFHPPPSYLLHSLLKHFNELLEVSRNFSGTLSGPGIVSRIISNFANIQNIL